jgi:iron complex outermembrane receptor protein
MYRLISRTLFSVFLLASSLFCLPLLAQETPPPPQDDKQATSDQKVSEEIVVTARKREETVLDVPMSVAAPTESQLRDRGAETIEDIAQNVAGFQVQNLGPGQSQVAMRGVSAGQIVRDQPGVKEQVGVYLDESVLSMSLFTPDLDLFDVSRVEVLRGPQGTLFGSGSLSGTVRYITNQPQLGLTETIGELSASTITDGGNGATAKVAANVPLSDAAAMRVAAYYTNYGGFIDAVQPDLTVNKNVNSGDRIGARLAFLVKPNEKLSITPRLVYQEVNMDGWNRTDLFNILANPYTTRRPQVVLGERRQFTQIEEPFSDDFLLGDLNLSYDVRPNMTLTSVTSYTDRDILVVRDATALTASITGGSFGAPESVYTLDAPLYDATKGKGFTQELRLATENTRWHSIAGVFYSNSKRDYTQNLPVNGFEDGCRFANCGPLTGISTAGTKLAKKDELYKSDLHYDNKQLALFGELTYNLTDRVDVTGGLRYYDFDEDRTQVFDGIFSDPNDSVGSTSATGFAPRVMVGFKASENTRLNAQISKGFRLGGINDPLNVPLCTAADLATFGGRESWDDEELWNYEVGSKSRIAGGRGSFNVAAFYGDIKDLQATVTAGSCSSRVVFNVPKAHAAGAEIEFELAPSNMFDFAIAASRTDSRLDSTLTSTDAAGHVSVVAGIEKGKRLPTVPQFQASAAATFHWTMPATAAGYATAAFQHVGTRYTQIGDQAPGFGIVNLASFGASNMGGPFTQSTFTFDPKLSAYNIINLRFGILKNQWDTALFINNLADEAASLALDQERGTRARVGVLTNQPRTIGISTRVTF